MTKRWRIIFYDMLHPNEPRCLGEVQFTNKRICLFKKHKRYGKLEVIQTLYHEALHIFFRAILKENQLNNLLDKTLDLTDYTIGKLVHLKAIVKEKGWTYYKSTYHPWKLKTQWNSHD